MTDEHAPRSGSSDDDQRGQRRRRGRRGQRDQRQEAPSVDAATEGASQELNAPIEHPAPSTDDAMPEPKPRHAPIEREVLVCEYALAPLQEAPPFRHRRDLATIRHREVDRYGEAVLVCDCLHDGAHEWPHRFAALDVVELTQDADQSPDDAAASISAENSSDD